MRRFHIIERTADGHSMMTNWAQYQVPVFSSGMVQVNVLQGLGVHRFVGFTFFGGPRPDLFARHLTGAGFDVAGMETLPERPREWSTISAEDIYHLPDSRFC